VHKLRIYK
jgi:hypothetical protein